MPIESLYIARAADGLVLVASMDSSNASSNDKMEMYKNQAKQLLKKLNPRSASKMSIETNPYIFHYMIDQGICYLALTDKSYPKRLAFLFLEEIAKDFIADLNAEYGENWMHTVDTVGRQYAFIKFDRIIQKKRREYSDPNSSSNIEKINSDLQSIHSIMRKTIDDVLDRGNKLEDVTHMSKQLANDSKSLKWGAKKLNMMVSLLFMREYVSYIVVLLFVGDL